MSTLLMSLTLLATLSAQAGNNDGAGAALAREILDRPANQGRVGTMNFQLLNAAGRNRTRVAVMAHSESDEQVRVAIYFTAPAAIEGTAFVNHEQGEQVDASWLYLPATERVRRLPNSERGDYFMGTDLTYGDIKDNFKFRLEDWHFTLGEDVQHQGARHAVLLGEARSAALAREMGYSAFMALVDPETLFPVVIEFSDTEGQPLKRVTVEEQGLIGEAWTALRFSVQQHQTGHRTEITFEDMRHVPDLDPRVFEARALAYGVPRNLLVAR